MLYVYCMRVCIIYVCVYMCICMCVYVCICIYVCVCIYVYVCMCIKILFKIQCFNNNVPNIYIYIYLTFEQTS